MRYFIVTYVQTPDKKYNESIHLDTKLKDKALTSAAIIIDFKEQKIVKSRHRDPTISKLEEYRRIVSFYRGHYPDIINQFEAKYEIVNDVKQLILDGIANGNEVALTTDDVKLLTEQEKEELDKEEIPVDGLS